MGHGLTWLATIVIGTETALGLLFDPRYNDFLMLRPASAQSWLTGPIRSPALDSASMIHFATCLASSGSIPPSGCSLRASTIAVAIIEFTWCSSDIMFPRV